MDFNELRKQYESMNEEEKQERDRKILEQREKQEAVQKNIKQQKEKERQNAYFNSLPKRYKNASFENFIGLEEDRKKIEKLTGGIIYGSNGNGKTYLGYAACRKVVENGGKAELITAKDLFDLIKKEFNNPNNSGNTIKHYASLDFLVIDECDKIYGSQTEYLSLIELIGKRYNEILPTLIISNCNSLKELAELISLSCIDKLREGEKLAFIDEKGLKYKSMRGKEEQAWLKEQQSSIKR